MPINASLTGGLPILQRSVDLRHALPAPGTTWGRIKALYNGRRASGPPKVRQHANGGLTVRPRGADAALNLKAMFTAAKPPSAKGGRAATAAAPAPNPMPGSASGERARGVADATAPQPASAAPSHADTVAALKDGVGALAGEVRALEALHEAARGPQSRAKPAGLREVAFLDARDAADAKIARLLGEVGRALEAADDAAKGDPAAAASLRGLRLELLGLSVAAEFPRLGAALHAPLPSLPAPLGTAQGAEAATIRALDGEVRSAIARFDDPARTRPVAVDPRVTDGLAQAIDGLRASEPGSPGAAMLHHLEALKAGIELRSGFDQAVAHVSTLGEGRMPVAKLAREITYLPGMFELAQSDDVRDQRDAMAVLAGITGQMARDVVPDMLVPRDPVVAAFVHGIRERHCQGLAATTFAQTLAASDPAMASALKGLETAAKSAGRGVKAVDVRALLADPEQLKAFDTRMGAAKDAAADRKAYFEQLGRLQRVVGADAAFAYKGSVWMKLGLPRNAQTYKDGKIDSLARKIAQGLTGEDAIVERQRSVAAMRKLAKANPNAAFLVAGLAYLEHKVAAADKEVLGLPYYDNIDIAAFDAERVFTYAGVTRERLVKLGYDPALADEFPKRMLNLSKAGLHTPRDTEVLRQFMHKASLEVFSNRAIQSSVGDFSHESGGAAAKRALVGMLSDAAAVHTGQPAPPGGDPRLSAASKPVVDGFKKTALSLDRRLGDDPRLATNLGATNKLFAAAEAELVDALLARTALDERVSAAKGRLTAAMGDSGPLGGLDLDPASPRGLDSAKAIRAALSFQTMVEAAERDGARGIDLALLRGARDAELEKLRGFDAESMRRPWYNKLATVFGRAERPSVPQLAVLAGVADDIILLREGAGAERAAIDGTIGRVAQLRQNVAALRMAEDAPAMVSARQMIRAAVLANWPADNVSRLVRGGQVVDAYEPALHKEAILKTLGNWGLDTVAFAPEIAMACEGVLTHDELDTWAAATRRADPADGLIHPPEARSRGRRILDAVRHDVGEVFTRRTAKDAALFLLANKKAMDEQFKEDLFAIHQSLKDGDKFDFKTGYKVSVNTGKVPVEPTGTLGVRMKAAFSALGNVVLERSSDGWKVTARFGAQASAGVEAIADWRLDPHGAFAVGASAGIEGQHTILGGYTVTFPPGEPGRAACAALLRNLASGEKPSAELFEAAAEAASNLEVGSKTGVSAKGYAKAEWTNTPFGNDGDVFGESVGATDKSAASNKLGFGASATVEVGGSFASKWKIVESPGKSAWETEREISGGIGLNVGAYAKVLTLPGVGLGELSHATGAQKTADAAFHKTDEKGKTTGLWDIGSSSANESLLNLDIGASLGRVRKTKVEFTAAPDPAGGQPLTKAEITCRSTCALGANWAVVGIGNKALAEILEHDPGFRADYDAIRHEIGRNDALQVTYGLNAEKLARYNELRRTAVAHKAAGRDAQAAGDLARADRMLDDVENYAPTKVTVLKKVVQKDVSNRGNAILARFDITAEATWEESEVVLKVDAGKLAAAHAKALAAA